MTRAQTQTDPRLRIAQWNILSLTGTRPKEIEHAMNLAKIDIALIQETKLLEKDPTPKITGYDIFRCDRPAARLTGTGRGGGLALLVRTPTDGKHDIKIVPIEREAINDESEVQTVRVHYMDRVLRLSNVYLPPPPHHRNALETRVPDPAKALNCTLPEDGSQEPILVAGDFNAHHDMWDTQMDTDARGNAMEEWLRENTLTLANRGDKPTFIGNHGTNNTSNPDLTISSKAAPISSWKVMEGPEWRCSDHRPITFEVSLPPENANESRLPRLTPKRTTYFLRKANWEKFNDEFRQRRPEPPTEYTPKVLNHYYTEVEAALVEAANEAIPRGCRQDPVPWWSDDIQTAILARQVCEDALQTSPTEENKSLYQDARTNVETVIREAKKQHWRNFVSTLSATTNSTKVHRVIKSINREKTKQTTVLYGANGAPIVRDDKKAAAFLSKFAANSNPKHDRLARTESRRKGEEAGCMKAHKKEYLEPRVKQLEEVKVYLNSPDTAGDESLKDFSEEELKAAIYRMKNNKAPGIDGIKNEMIKNLDKDNRLCLLGIFNLSFRHSWMPPQWSRGLIIPIPKPGKDSTQVQNYRPVCMLSVLLKCMETLMNTRLSWTLERGDGETPLLGPTMYAYRARRDTTQPLMRFVSETHNGFNATKGLRRTVLVVTDVEKAFESADHKILMDQFRKLGTAPRVARWYLKLLRGRRYTVQVGHHRAKFKIFKAGFPQGGGASPLLWKVYTHTLPQLMKDVNTELIQRRLPQVSDGLFADDLSIWATSRHIVRARKSLRHALLRVYAWAKSIRMSFSSKKTQAMLFTTAPTEMSPADGANPDNLRKAPWTQEDETNTLPLPNGDPIVPSHTITLLGTLLDASLTFTPHYRRLRKRASARISQLTTMANTDYGSTVRDLRALAISWVLSLLRHNLVIYYPRLGKENRRGIQTILNTCARIATGARLATQEDVLMQEFQHPPYHVIAKTVIATAAEKLRRLPLSDPARKAAEQTVPTQRTFFQSTWQVASEIILWNSGIWPARRNTILPGVIPVPPSPQHIRADNRIPNLMYPRTAPWRAHRAKDIHFARGAEKYSGETEEEITQSKKAISTAALTEAKAHMNPKWSVYTDGSVLEKQGIAAAAAFIPYTDPNGSGVETDKLAILGDGIPNPLRAPAGPLASPFSAEAEAIKQGANMALAYLATLQAGEAGLLITDSMSNWEMLKKGPLNQTATEGAIIWETLLALVRTEGSSLTILHVYSHCGIDGNEIADKACAGPAYSKAEMEQVPISLTSVTSHVRGFLTAQWGAAIPVATGRTRNHALSIDLTQAPTKAHYTKVSTLEQLDRRVATISCQLRTGQIPTMGALYRKLKDPADHKCRWCRNKPETVLHVYRFCRNAEVQKLRDTHHCPDITTTLTDPPTAVAFHDAVMRLLLT